MNPKEPLPIGTLVVLKVMRNYNPDWWQEIIALSDNRGSEGLFEYRIRDKDGYISFFSWNEKSFKEVLLPISQLTLNN